VSIHVHPDQIDGSFVHWQFRASESRQPLTMLNTLKSLLLFSLVLGFPAAAWADDASLSGVWTGTGIQGEQSWSIRVTFGPKRVQIDYPSLACGGIWQPASGDPGPGRANYHERLEYGLDACAADGFVRLRKTLSGIDYEWSRSQSAPVEATASLTRERAEPPNEPSGRSSRSQ